ncbi:MAG: VOC family protein [Stenotrophomonas nitritireducens]|uniref:VOC family protein n=1 Tax=Stenotrophomonas TaxID=40323 RepID=UPI001AD3838F|nr:MULTISPECIES: VOC family protein [Stenotrophomonas]MBN8792774.1 VOC family protein [Stenotrophomonas nitritireducens]MBN8796368.1 VOC family protein [Stenotrophomonas nitritireducens]
MSMATPQMIFVNLPVRDLDASKAFFAALGYTFNPQFTNQDAACMVVSDSIYVMLLVEPFFQTFTRQPLCDARRQTEVITCLSATSRAAVDQLVDKALAAGASEPMPARDYGFMYQRGFQDLDGHLWEIAHMDGEPG